MAGVITMIRTKIIFARLLIILALAAPWAAQAADQKYEGNGMITAKTTNKFISINDFEYNLSPTVRVSSDSSRAMVLSELKKGDFVRYTVVVLYGKHWVDTIKLTKLPAS